MHLHGREWTYHCCRATNREGFPEGTSNPEEARCRAKAELISRSFEMTTVAPGSVAGCLEFSDRVVFAQLCGTAPSDCHSTKCTGCTVLYKSIGNHTWCLPEFTHPRLYEEPKAASKGECGSNNMPAALRASWHYGYTANITGYHIFNSEPRATPSECSSSSPAETESRWIFPPMRAGEQGEPRALLACIIAALDSRCHMKKGTRKNVLLECLHKSGQVRCAQVNAWARILSAQE